MKRCNNMIYILIWLYACGMMMTAIYCLAAVLDRNEKLKIPLSICVIFWPILAMIVTIFFIESLICPENDS